MIVLAITCICINKISLSLFTSIQTNAMADCELASGFEN